MTRISTSELHREINDLIRPKGGCPLGIKLFEDKTEFDKFQLKSPKRQLALCQVTKLASTRERTIGVNRKDIDACVLGSYVLGFLELPNDFMQKWMESRNYTSEKFQKFIQDIHALPMGKYKAALLSPLRNFERRNIDPDLVFLSVNSAQAYLILCSYYDATAQKPTSDFNGHAACEIFAATIMNRKPWLTIPCGGARAIAEVQDDELWITMTLEQMDKTVKWQRSKHLKYPLPLPQMLEMSPDPDHPLTHLLGR